ncbi:hypothetical protein EYF80_041428 [Liparis tanakae]|uniref:Uncharacterized protein n=1 Tax=Liparis tanakae TaxID=230148 RepID=A0A4Z2G5I5_9TELE|nr:hypothetical protein EYF80_041428 [Liparis tanakae]
MPTQQIADGIPICSRLTGTGHSRRETRLGPTAVPQNSLDGSREFRRTSCQEVCVPPSGKRVTS